MYKIECTDHGILESYYLESLEDVKRFKMMTNFKIVRVSDMEKKDDD